MNILLTGGTGFIGSHLINEIHSRKFNIFSLKRKSSNIRIQLNKEPNWILDENEVELIETMKKCDIFVNCAAIGVSPQKASWNELINYNIGKSMSLFLMAKKANIKKFIFMGSSLEMESNSFLSFQDNKDITPYSVSKSAAFYLFYSYSKLNNLKMKYLRLPNVYGDGQFPQNLWPSLKKAAFAGKDYKIINNNIIRNFISVEKTTKIIADNLIFDNTIAGSPKIINLEGEKKKVGEFSEYYWKKWQAKGKLIF